MSNIKTVLDKTRDYLCNLETDQQVYEAIQKIVNHENQDDLVDYIDDDLIVWEKVQNEFTCEEFLDEIGYYPNFEQDYNNSGIPQVILDAFNHVKEYYSAVNMVVFNREGQWLFLDSDFDSPSFGEEIDTTILDKAVDEAYKSFGLPYVYQES